MLEIELNDSVPVWRLVKKMAKFFPDARCSKVGDDVTVSRCHNWGLPTSCDMRTALIIDGGLSLALCAVAVLVGALFGVNWIQPLVDMCLGNPYSLVVWLRTFYTIAGVSVVLGLMWVYLHEWDADCWVYKFVSKPKQVFQDTKEVLEEKFCTRFK